MFEVGRLYFYKEFFNGKLLNIFQIKAVSEDEDTYRFQAFNEKCNAHYNIHKDCFPTHRWMTDKNVERMVQIVEAK